MVNRFVLIPWKRPDDLKRAMDSSRGFIVDNSAFSFWRNGDKPSWSEYLDWCKTICRHPRFHFAIIPDVIDGDEKENDELLRWWDKHAWHPVRILSAPVWHMHESIDRLIRLCSGRFDTVCIGSSGQWPTPAVGGWWDRMDEAFAAITDEHGYPLAKIHGLRMLRNDIIERYPLASADSTNAAQNGLREAAKNSVDQAWGSMTIARRIESVNSPGKFAPIPQQQLKLAY